LDTTQWWSDTLPSTNDGKLYIRLGTALAAENATISFLANRPIFYHDGSKICEYNETYSQLIFNRPTTGSYVLKCVDGVISWVAE
jgi:hypothetical protein